MKQKGYTQEFVRKIEQGEKDIAEGKCTVIDVKDLWKSIGLTSHKNRKNARVHNRKGKRAGAAGLS